MSHRASGTDESPVRVRAGIALPGTKLPVAVLLGAILAAATVPALAQTPETEPVSKSGIWSMVIENDLFTGTDRHYTNGLMLSYVRPTPMRDSRMRRAAVALPWISTSDDIYVSYSLGHEIYTPENTNTTLPVEDDRPYAGYLYGAIGFLADDGRHLDSWRLSLGIVGPSAGAEQVQRRVHERIGGDEIRGWDNQLRDEPIMLIDYERRWRALYATRLNGVSGDVVPYAGFSAGNLAVDASLGVALRVGYGLDTDYGPPRIRPALPGGFFFRGAERPAVYFFVSAGGRYVAHDLFLDGNTWKDSPSVDIEHWVRDAQAGVVLNSGNFRFAYTHVWQDRQFEAQQQPSIFGSLALSMRF